MTKSMIALIASAFAVAGIATHAFADPNSSRCSNAPKDYLPCSDSTDTAQPEGN